MTLFLLAHIGGHCVAFDTATIESVVDIDAIVPAPRADPTVRGLAALRSRVVTVIDTAAALGLAPRGSAIGRAVIGEVDGHPYAFAVDSLEDVADYVPRPLAGGMTLADGWAHAATSYIERGDEAILVVAVGALIPGAVGRIDRAA